jgi:hypothetical protein
VFISVHQWLKKYQQFPPPNKSLRLDVFLGGRGIFRDRLLKLHLPSISLCTSLWTVKLAEKSSFPLARRSSVRAKTAAKGRWLAKRERHARRSLGVGVKGSPRNLSVFHQSMRMIDQEWSTSWQSSAPQPRPQGPLAKRL